MSDRPPYRQSEITATGRVAPAEEATMFTPWTAYDVIVDAHRADVLAVSPRRRTRKVTKARATTEAVAVGPAGAPLVCCA